MDANSPDIKEEYERAKTYWRNKFPGEITGINLPCDFQRGMVYNGRENKISLKEDITARLLALSKNQEILLYIVLLSALKFLMYKYMNNGDISIGAPVYSTKDLGQTGKRLIIFRDFLDHRMTFKELLLEVKQTVLEGYRHQHYVIEDILDALGVTIPVKPLSKIILLLENIHKKEMINEIIHSPANDIALSFLKSGDRITGSIEYNSELFEEGTIARIYGHYQNSLEQIVGNINIKLSEIDILTQEERKQILSDFNDTAAVYPINETVVELFAHREERAPGKIAVEEENVHLSYGELNRRANERARILETGGVTPGAIVALMLDDSLEIVTGILGVLKAGAAYLPIDPTQPWERKKYIIEDSGINTLIIQEDLKENQKELEECTLLENILPVAAYDGNEFSPPVFTNAGSPPGSRRQVKNNPAGLAYIIYTSGTTGRPKGVLVDHRGIVNYTTWRVMTYGLTPADVTLQLLPYYFDGYCSNFYSGLLSGGTLVMIPDAGKLDPDYIRASIKKHNVTNMSVVPPMYRVILSDASAGELSHLRFVVLAGEKTGVNLIKESKEIAPAAALVNEYGPSEATVTAAGYWGMNESNRGVIGNPISNTRIYILDPSLKPVPVNVNGELCIAGPGVAWGYLNKPGLTKEKFTANPLRKGERIYHTGDLAKWRPDGKIEIIGRVDRQVKIRGYRIELPEIETHLNRMEAVKEAVVVEYRQSEEENFLCAYLVTNREVDITGLREILTHDLPDYMIPSYFVQLEKIPLTPNGKPDRKALPYPQIKTKEIIPPGNPSEEKLVKIWAEVLGVETEVIGIDSNFFDLGGHSLKATVMISRVHKEFNVKLSLAEMFKAPSIRAISEAIKGKTRDTFLTLEPAEKREYYALSSAQKRLYVALQAAPGSTVYNIPQSLELQKADRRRLTETFVKLISRHENLRTAFILMGNEPRQKIEDTAQVEIELYETGKGEQPADTIGKIYREFVRPFDLSVPPLLRVGMMEISAQKTLLMVDMHHIISDAVSNEILVKDFDALYRGESLPPLRLQYKDYSRWQNSPAQQEALEKQKTYWLKEFEKEPPVLALPADYPVPGEQNFEGNTAVFTIGKKETAALRQLAAEEGGTLYLVLLTIYYIFLSKISGQQDIVIGTTVANRGHADLEKIIGMFVNMLALRNYPRREMRFIHLLREVKKRTLEAFENQDFPFDDLVKSVVSERVPGRNPLFDAAIDIHNIEMTPMDKTGDEADNMNPGDYSQPSGISRFAISLSGTVISGTLHLAVEYSTQWFKPGTITKLIDFFKEIVTRVLENRSIVLQDIRVSHELETTKKDFLRSPGDMDEF